LCIINNTQIKFIMNTQIQVYEFKGNQIEFQISEKEIMPNATKMAKCFEGKRVFNFLKSETTKEFLKVLEEKYGNKVFNYSKSSNKNDENLDFNYGDSRNKNDENLDFGFEVSENILKVSTGRYGGTWMHEILALEFASWLNPHFKLWIYETVHNLIIGVYQKLIESYVEFQKADEEEKLIKEELRNFPKYLDLLDIKKRKSNIKKSINGFKSTINQNVLKPV